MSMPSQAQLYSLEMKKLLLLLALLLGWGGCDTFEYEGFHKPFAIQRWQNIPIAHLTFNGGLPVRAAVDTGSPLVISSQLGAGGGSHDADLRILEPMQCRLDCHCEDAATPLCDSGSGHCVARMCATNQDCKSPFEPTCEQASGRCVAGLPECSKSEDCSNPSRPLCQGGVCAADRARCAADKLDPRRSSCSGGQCIYFNPRFIFFNTEVFALDAGQVGLSVTTPLGGLLGASLLQRFAVRFNYSNSPSMTLLDEIPDLLDELADDCTHDSLTTVATAKDQRCSGVFTTPLMGGGVMETASESINLPPTRLVLSLCLMPALFDRSKDKGHGAEATSGTPVNSVLATGLGISIISRSAFERLCTSDSSYRASTPQCTKATAKFPLHLPYGPEQVFIVRLYRAAVVSNETSFRGACGELALRRRLLIAGSAGLTAEDQQLLNDKQVNGASVALVKTPMLMAVLDDESRLLQGYRQELRPHSPDIDFVLGGSFLEHFDLDVDYPGHRTIFRCARNSGLERCEVLPFCAHAENSDKTEIHCPTKKP